MAAGYRQPDNCPSATYNASGVSLSDRQETALQCDAQGQLKIAGNITASLGGFQPSGTYTTPLSVSSTSSNTAISGSDPVQMITNVGSVTAYVNLGTSAAVVATTSDIPISAGASVPLTVGSNTYLAAITASSTTTLNIAGGTGLLTGIAGSPSVSGSNPAAGSTGSAVPASASYSAVNVAGTLRGQTGVNPSGSVYAAQFDVASIGGTTVSASSGVLNVSSVLTAGTALIGKVGIDQTTPGSTNAVDATNFPATVDAGAGNSSSSTVRVVVATNQAAVAISAASLPLPTGAATAAKQPALGTAGSASSDVLTIQGITSMTPLSVSQSGTWTVGISASQSIAVTQGTASSLNATVVGTGTFAVQAAQSGTWNITNVSGTVSLPTGAATAANQILATAATAATVPADAVYDGLLGKTALPTAVSDGQLVGAMADKYGRQIVRGAPRELLVTAAISTTGTSGTLLGSQGTGVYADLYRLVIANSSAAAVLVSILDGTNTYAFEVPANGTVGFSGAAADAIPAASTATAWTYTVASGTTTIYISAQFILNK